MGKFDIYKINLKSLSPGVYEYEYALENKFFIDIDGDEVQKGKVKVSLTLKHSNLMSEMNFTTEGVVYVSCDRCLDYMELPIETKNRLIVKIGKEYSEESDEIVIIPADEGAINLAWFIYEFIALSIPIKHIHPVGKCNKAMSTKLRKHSAKSSDDDDDADDGSDDMLEYGDEGGTDPRWDALRGFADNDNEDNNN